MAAPRIFMHFSREDLYTDLETRIRYLHSFVDFSSSQYQPMKLHASIA